MTPRNFVSEATLTEHFGDCGFHLVEDEETNENEETRSEEEKFEEEVLLISEVREPFEPESHEWKHESPVEDYLDKVNDRFYKQPKVAQVELGYVRQ